MPYKTHDAQREAEARWRERNRERLREYARAWRQTEAGRAYQRRATDAAREKRQADPDHYKAVARARKLKVRYGITADEYDALLEKQGGVCAVCSRDPSGHTRHPLHVDHCHTTGAVRGLLCATCNLALGYMADNPEWIENLAAYAKRGRKWTP